jgi:carboxymethylenebutenolidase
MGEKTLIHETAGATDAYLAPAQPSPGPPVMLLHAWWGLNQTMRDLADRLASDGFTVLAPDLFDGTVLNTIEDAETFTTSIEKGDGRPDGLNPDRIMSRVGATLDHLLSHPHVRGDRAGIIALSFGGWYGSHVAGARSDVAAFVSIYSDVFEGPGGAAYLGHFAEQDPYIDSAEVPDDGSAFLYPGTKHWFMEPDRPEFDAAAAELVYARTVKFLHKHLDG